MDTENPDGWTVTETLVSDRHGTIIGWVTAAEGYWLAYHQSVFGVTHFCGAHSSLAAAADAVRDRQEVRR